MTSGEHQRPAETLRIFLLGEFRVETSARSVDEASWRLRKARSLVKILALAPEHRMHRERMMELLWPDADPRAALGSLNQALHAARRSLLSGYEHPPDPGEVIRHQNQILSLLPFDPLWIDVDTFEARARDASRTGDERIFEEAISFYRGELLPEDLYEDWATERRVALHRLYLGLLHEFSNRFEARGELARAIDVLRTSIRAGPVNEELHATLMRLYAQTGRRQRAIEQYQELKNILLQELDVEPAPATEELYRQIVDRSFPASAQMGATATRPALVFDQQPGNGPGMFGREDELHTLWEAVREGLTGHGRMVLLAGEPGIGKTTLAEAVSRPVEWHPGSRVYWGRCFQDEGVPAYWPWVQIIRDYLDAHDDDTVAHDLGRHAASIMQIVPEVRQRIPDIPDTAGTNGGSRFQLFDTLSNVLKRIAERTPLLLVLDDLHWADRSSLLLLDFLAGDLRLSPVVVLGIYRESEVDRFHPLSSSIGQIVRQPGNRRIRLEGLQREDVGRFMTAMMGSPPPDTLLSDLYALTEGNPFFVGEVMQLLVQEGTLDGRSWQLVIPQSVREVVRQRLDRLSFEAHALLAVCAVIGRDFGVNVLHAVTGTAHDELLNVLEEAVDARILTERADAPGHYRFAHMLVRETIYGDLGIIRRTQLHGSIGAALETLFADNTDAHLAELAHHFYRSAPRQDVERAVDYLTRAGTLAMEQVGFDEAAGYFTRALTVLDLATPVDYPRRCTLLLALGDAQRSAGDSAGSRETCLQAAMLARRLNLPEHLAQAAATVGWASMEIRHWDSHVVRLLEEALQALGPVDSIYRVQVLGALVRVLDYSGEIERRAALGDEAVAVARRLNDPATLVHALESRLKAAIRPEDLERLNADAEEIIRLADITGDSYMSILGHLWRIDGVLGKGDMREVDRSMAAVTRLSRERNEPRRIWEALCIQTMRALLAGRYDEAERLAAEAVEVGRRPAPRPSWTIYIEHIFVIRREQGRLAELESYMRERVSSYGSYPFYHALLTVLLADTGQLDEAREVFERLARDDFQNVPRDVAWLVTIALLAEMAHRFDDTRRARALYEMLQPYPDRSVVPDSIEFCLGSSSHYIGLLAATLGLHTETRQAFESAIAMNRRMGARPYLAHSSYAYGRWCLASDDPRDRAHAHELVTGALDIAHELRMSRLARQCITLRADIQNASSA